MPFKFKQLLFYFILFNFIWSIALGANNGSIVSYYVSIFKNLTSFTLKVTSTFSFFLYTFSGYLFLWISVRRKKQILGFLLIALCIPFVILFRFFLEEMVCPAIFGFQNYNSSTTITYYLQDNIYFSIPYTALGIVFYFFQSNRYKELEKTALALQNRQAELAFLKSQINPHFLFNNLNSIYSLIYHKSDKALKAVEQLSNLLRYMLYNKKDEVLLSEEVDYLNNYIDLQKLRYNYDLPLYVKMDIQNEIKCIAPLLLIPIVENAFKHGEFKNQELPLSIELYCSNDVLCFTVENQKGHHQKDEGSGIGIKNLQRRLELLYPSKHQFTIEESISNYKATLKITWE